MFMTLTSVDELKQWMNDHQLSSSSIDMETFSIANEVKSAILKDGDQALINYTQKFDGVHLISDQLKISNGQIDVAFDEVNDQLIQALKNAAKNIEAYHLNQVPSDWEKTEKDQTYGVQYRPLDAVGLYVPGGRAAYPSTVLMTAIPAKIAGTKRRVMVSPPTGGRIPPSVLVAAQIAGINEIYQIGGAQSIFALAYGTQSILAVDKIVGPGNRFVTAAKQMVYGVVDIDKPAGPSEVCVFIDDINYASFAAAEMWAQLEHDPDASAICICSSNAIAEAVNNYAKKQYRNLKRQAILAESQSNAIITVLDSNTEQLSAINYCASEHLVLLSNAADDYRHQVNHAGSIFSGPYTPVTLGDYYAGPNHVLPTARSARFASPLGVMDYMKYSSYLSYTKTKLESVETDINELTEAEGFDAHNQAVKVRLQ